MHRILTAALALSGLWSADASATVNFPDTDYLWVFNGQVTAVHEVTGPDVYYAPFLDVGDPITGALGINWWGGVDHGGNVRFISEDVIYYSATLIDYTGGFTNASFETKEDFVPGGNDPVTFRFSIEGSHDAAIFNLKNGELFSIGGIGYAGFHGGEYSAFWFNSDNQQIQQIANRQGQSVPSHYFDYEGEWQVVKLRRVAEASPLALIVPGMLLALSCVRGARRRR